MGKSSFRIGSALDSRWMSRTCRLRPTPRPRSPSYAPSWQAKKNPRAIGRPQPLSNPQVEHALAFRSVRNPDEKGCITLEQGGIRAFSLPRGCITREPVANREGNARKTALGKKCAGACTRRVPLEGSAQGSHSKVPHRGSTRGSRAGGRHARASLHRAARHRRKTPPR